MKLQRAYSLLEIKAIDEEKREITGIATTISTDRYGDIVEPEGAEFELPLILLWQHDAQQPVGHVIAARPTKTGIPVTVKIFKSDEPGLLKDRLDLAWQSVKLQLVRAFSIGFQPKEYVQIEGTYAYRFTKWEWLELSLVTIPANAECTITAIKSIDTALRAASGHAHRVVKLISPGVSGIKQTVKLIPRN